MTTIEKFAATVFFNLERPGSFMATDADRELRGIDGVVDATVVAVHGRTYPVTRSVTDSGELGSAFIVADTAEDLDRIRAQVNRTVNSWFKYRPRHARRRNGAGVAELVKAIAA
jgi:hypothetical protein